MGLLDDTAIFAAVIQQGGFSRAAKQLGLSNGLISRRISQLEAKLGVTLIKRTTRQLHLTPEGELFWQHANRIQQELDSAMSLIQSSAKKPKGTIRLSAPLFFGKQYLTPILLQFMDHFPDIHIHLTLGNERLDPIKEQLDLMIRGAGYLDATTALKDSSMQMKLLFKEKIGLYASPEYLLKHGVPQTPADLAKHVIVSYINSAQVQETNEWSYQTNHDQHQTLTVKPQFNCNDIEASLIACIAGRGIGKFTQLNVKHAIAQQQLRPVLTAYQWGNYHLYAIFSQQQALPKRTRLLLDFINGQIQHLIPPEIV